MRLEDPDRPGLRRTAVAVLKGLTDPRDALRALLAGDWEERRAGRRCGELTWLYLRAGHDHDLSKLQALQIREIVGGPKPRAFARAGLHPEARQNPVDGDGHPSDVEGTDPRKRTAGRGVRPQGRHDPN